MAFLNRLNLVVPDFGTPLSNDTLFLSQANSISTTGSPITVTLSGFTAPYTLKDYYVRVKIYGGATAAGTITNVAVLVGDGTNIVLVGNMVPSSTAAAGGAVLSTTASTGSPYTNSGTLGTNISGLDVLFAILTDLAITQVSVIVTMTGSTATAKMDIEICGSN